MSHGEESPTLFSGWGEWIVGDPLCPIRSRNRERENWQESELFFLFMFALLLGLYGMESDESFLSFRKW